MDPSIIFEQYDANDSLVVINSPTQKFENEILRFLYQKLTYENDKVKYTWEYDKGFHDGNEHVFDKNKKRIPIGLIPKTVNYLKEGYPQLKVGVSDEIRQIYSNPNKDITKEQVEQYCETLNIYNLEKNKDITPWEHQIRLIERAINGRRISLMACTSSGKSLSIMTIARYLMDVEKRKVIIITPSAGLVRQLFNDFSIDYGWKEAEEHCTLVYSQSKDKLTAKQKESLEELNLGEEVMHKDITISTWQSLQNKRAKECPSCSKMRVKRNKPRNCPDCKNIKSKAEKFFNAFTAIIVDEAHSVRGEVLRDILGNCNNATNYKIGMSGTLPDKGLESAWIEGALGRKEHVVKMHELITLGILPPLKIHAIKIPYNDKVRRFVCRQNFDNEYYLLTNNGSRKKAIEILIDSKKITAEQNSLLLFKRLDTLKEMHEFLEKKYPQFKYHIITGVVTVKNREEMRAELRKNTGNVIIATYGTMKQGVNIELLHNLVFAEFSKSMYSIVQSLGRVARFHKDKKISNVFDLYDDCSYLTKPRTRYFPTLVKNYSYKHFDVRNQYYVDQKLPVTEYSLEGFYEATIDPDELKNRKDRKKKEAVEKAKKKKVKARPKKQF